ncbi:MAG TPA: hypothetical protein VHU83_03615 [Bryobacteraceae bacterium]|jgi:hypothetical protein|nr:hypothetical protein [Bryobacteraceae bacterium]
MARELLEVTVVYWAAAMAVCLMYKSSRTFQLGVIPIAALAILFVQTATGRLGTAGAAVVGVTVAGLIGALSSRMYGWLARALSEDRRTPSLAIIELAVFSVYRACLGLAYGHRPLDERLYVHGSEEIALALLGVLGIGALLYTLTRSGFLSKLELGFWDPGFSCAQGWKQLRIQHLSLTFGYALFAIAAIVQAGPGATQTRLEDLLDTYSVGLLTCFICGRNEIYIGPAAFIIAALEVVLLPKATIISTTLLPTVLFVLLLARGYCSKASSKLY